MSAAGSTIIDIFCHIFPERYFQEMTRAAPNLENMGKRLKQVTKLFDLDARFKEMDEFGDYRQIISLPNPAIEDIARPDAELATSLGLPSKRNQQRGDGNALGAFARVGKFFWQQMTRIR